MSLDNVKSRIRKLLALAEDDAQGEAEVCTAMKLAEAALEKYHLDRADIEADQQESAQIQEEYGANDAFMRGVKMTAWESTLGRAIDLLVGSVKHYHSYGIQKTGTFKAPKYKSKFIWYGPAEDVELATELFGEWQHVIATLAINKFGGFARKEGGSYAMGFAKSLEEKAEMTYNSRKSTITKSTTALVHCNSGSLADVLNKKREHASVWLKTTGVKLGGKVHGTRASMAYDGYNAYEFGRMDGRHAEFSAARKRKLGQ